MTLDLDDPDLFRQLLTDVPAPALFTRDITGLALHDGRRRVRRRRIAGMALGTSLSCLTALAAPRAIDALRGRSSSDAAGELWADPSTDAGSVIARVDNGIVVGPGPFSVVGAPTSGVVTTSTAKGADGTVQVVTGDSVSTLSMRDWRISWREGDTWTSDAPSGSGRIDPGEGRCLTARVEDDKLVISSGGGGRREKEVGRVPLTGAVTGVAVHLSDGQGWIALVAGRAATGSDVLPEVHLRDADLWAEPQGAVRLSTAAGVVTGVVSGQDTFEVAALRLREGGEKHNPFDEVAIDVTAPQSDKVVGIDDYPEDGSVVRTVAKTVLLEEH